MQRNAPTWAVRPSLACAPGSVGHPDVDDRAVVRAARDRHASAVRLGDPLDDPKAEPAADSERLRARAPIEAIEDAPELIGREADAGIRNDEHRPPIAFLDADVDGPPCSVYATAFVVRSLTIVATNSVETATSRATSARSA